MQHDDPLKWQLANAVIGQQSLINRLCDMLVKNPMRLKQYREGQDAIDAWTRANELRPGGQE